MKSKQPRKKIKCHLCLLCVLSNKILSTSHRPPTSPGQLFTKLNKLHIAPSNEVIWRTHTYVRTNVLYLHRYDIHAELVYCTHTQLQHTDSYIVPTQYTDPRTVLYSHTATKAACTRDNPKACQWNKGHPMQTLLELTAHQTTFHCGHYSSHASHLLQFTHSNGCPGSTAPNH